MQLIDEVDDIGERWLLAVDSVSRGGELVKILQARPDAEFKNKLLKRWFPDCEALKPWLNELREEFHKAGFVADTDEALQLPVRVYRAAWDGDDAQCALSWTTDLEVAKIIAAMCNSDRGRYLGIHRDDVCMKIYTGICTEALGYLVARGESEVIAGNVEDIETIAVSWT